MKNERTIHANETNEKRKRYEISVNLNDTGSVYLIQHYVIEFVSDLRHVSGILQVSSTNKTDHDDKTEILLKVTLNILIPK